MTTPQQLIHQYQLLPHPEGGWYRETYRSAGLISAAALPGFAGSRAYATAIYFLLEQKNFSAFHRIKSDECWHFYSGDPLLIYVLQPGGALDIVCLGSDISNGQLFQYVVPAHCWFASRPAPASDYCFAGCTVSPGFDFEDFELAEGNSLAARYPQHASLIRQLCR